MIGGINSNLNQPVFQPSLNQQQRQEIKNKGEIDLMHYITNFMKLFSAWESHVYKDGREEIELSKSIISNFRMIYFGLTTLELNENEKNNIKKISKEFSNLMLFSPISNIKIEKAEEYFEYIFKILTEHGFIKVSELDCLKYNVVEYKNRLLEKYEKINEKKVKNKNNSDEEEIKNIINTTDTDIVPVPTENIKDVKKEKEEIIIETLNFDHVPSYGMAFNYFLFLKEYLERTINNDLSRSQKLDMLFQIDSTISSYDNLSIVKEKIKLCDNVLLRIDNKQNLEITYDYFTNNLYYLLSTTVAKITSLTKITLKAENEK